MCLGGWIVLQKRAPVATLSWLLGLAALPYVGFFVYLVFGPQRIRRHRLRRARSHVSLPGNAGEGEGDEESGAGEGVDGGERSAAHLVCDRGVEVGETGDVGDAGADSGEERPPGRAPHHAGEGGETDGDPGPE